MKQTCHSGKKGQWNIMLTPGCNNLEINSNAKKKSQNWCKAVWFSQEVFRYSYITQIAVKDILLAGTGIMSKFSIMHSVMSLKNQRSFCIFLVQTLLHSGWKWWNTVDELGQS